MATDEYATEMTMHNNYLYDNKLNEFDILIG